MTGEHPDYNSTASAIARRAGALLMEYFVRGVKTEYKGAGTVDIVTDADRASEKLIIESLRAAFPDHGIVGEEGSRSQIAGEYIWYVDPLDGTTNFAHGFPIFCVSIGLARNNEVVAGVVYDPSRNELFAAQRGRGATLNGERIHVSKISKLGESLLGTGFPSKKRHLNPNIYFYHQLTMKSHGIRRAGSAALDLACVASGRYEGFWEFNLNAWDTAAGALLVEEAGGTLTYIDGSKFDVAESREVLATNGIIHRELMAEMKAVMEGRGIEVLPSPMEFAKSRG
ncbi:MAG TPA: inositol monophosphatase family protein [Terriglobales bacterium]|nr:inositol monophosphatase family protein [Terriglobales bacterium]